LGIKTHGTKLSRPQPGKKYKKKGVNEQKKTKKRDSSVTRLGEK